jgi:hypothetical protein
MEHLARRVLRHTTTIDRRTRIIVRTKRPLVPTRTPATMGVPTKLRAAATRRHVPVIRHLGRLTRRRIRGHTLLPTGTPRQAVATPHRAIRHRAAVTRHQAEIIRRPAAAIRHRAEAIQPPAAVRAEAVRAAAEVAVVADLVEAGVHRHTAAEATKPTNKPKPAPRPAGKAGLLFLTQRQPAASGTFAEQLSAAQGVR